MAVLSYTAAEEAVTELLIRRLVAVDCAIERSAVLADLGMDSIDRFEFIIALEDRFVGLSIDDDDIERLQTVGDVVDLVAARLLAGAS